MPVAVKWHPNRLSSMKRWRLSLTALLIWRLSRPFASHSLSQCPLWLLPRDDAVPTGRALHGGDGIGATVTTPAYPDPLARELYLFGETQGCAWVACEEERVADLLALGQELGCRALHAGSIGGDRLVIKDAHQQAAVDSAVADLRRAFETGLTDAIGLQPAPPRP